LRFCRPAVLLLLAVAVPLSLNAGTILADFEGFPDSTVLTTQYSGLSFSNAIVLTAGITLNEFEFPPRSGSNVASDNGGPVTITLAAPVQSFSGYFTYGHSLTLQAFGPTNNLLASAVSRFSNNEALSGATGSQLNELLQVSFSGGISKVTITGDPAGTSFTLDDMNAGSLPISVPNSVPAMTPLVLLALAIFIGLIGAQAANRQGGAGVALKSILACGLILPLLSVGLLWVNAQAQAQAQTRTGSTAPTRTAQPSSNIHLLRSHLSVSPNRITSGRPTTVTLTARISHPGHIPGSVNLIRLDASGHPTILGRLTDNGRDESGTPIYSIRVPLNEPVTGQIRLQVSGAIRGELKRALSQSIAVDVNIASNK